MIRLGSMNALTLLRRDDKGGWLDAEDFGEVLLPMRQLPRDAKPGSAVKVFVYLDGDEELVVTGFKPYAQVGEFVGLNGAADFYAADLELKSVLHVMERGVHYEHEA